MNNIESVESAVENGIIHSVLAECEFHQQRASWKVVLIDNHGRKGYDTGRTLESTMRGALVDLNNNCAGQVVNYIR